jgi:tetratricopeptide (TPR) repeat protein
MYFKYQKIKSLVASVIVFSILFGNLAVKANAKDIAPFEELSFGKSVFVFRGSSRKPQYNSTSVRYFKRNVANRKVTKPRRPSKKTVANRRKKSSVKTKSNLSLAANNAVNKLFDKAVENYNQGRYADAVATYKQVIALDATHPDAHANLASSYRQLERYALANAEYKFAADFIKDDTDMFSEWGFCLGKVDEWTKAVARLTTAKELNADAINFANIG